MDTDNQQAAAVEEALSGLRRILEVRSWRTEGWAELDAYEAIEVELSCGHARNWYEFNPEWPLAKRFQEGDLAQCLTCIWDDTR